MSKAAELAALIGSQSALSNRNLIINGAMQVAQRGDVTGITGESYGGPDRFELNASNIGTFTISQSSTAPTGFKKSWKVDCTTADASPASGDLLRVSYRIEGQDLQQLAYGTSGAKAVTLSFYVRSNKTGTYNVQFQQIDNSYKQAVLSYTISSADTWEFKSITVPGDTSGLINDDNGDGLALFWILGAGSTFTSGSERSTYTAFANGDVAPTQTVNLADNTANEWMITGVQLELGEQATPFEHRLFGDELRRCQRYYERHDTVGVNFARFATLQCIGTTGAFGLFDFKVNKRTEAVAIDTDVSKLALTSSDNNIQNATAISIDGNCKSFSNCTLSVSTAGNLSAGDATQLIARNDLNAYIAVDAEL